jgi:putative peptidoglycan lipid II flippase
VIANQVAYTIVVRIASSGTLGGEGGCAAGGPGGTGYTVYSNAFLLVMVPHSIITVSLATAMLPRLSGHAADGDLPALGRSLASTLRSTYAIVLPLLALVPVVALEAASLIFGYGAGASSYRNYVPTLSLFALGLFFFTTHYLVLRGFYALEKNRRVFLIQCVVAATNVVVAVLLTRGAPSAQTAPRLVVAYTAAYAVGAVLTYLQLDRAVGGLATGRTVRFGVRAGAAVAVATGIAWLVHRGLVDTLTGGGKGSALVVLLVVTVVDLGVYLVLARLLRVTEVTEVTSLLTRRLPWGRQQPPRRGGT